MESDSESADRMSDRSQAIGRIRRAREANLPIGPIVAELRQEGWSYEEVEGFVTLVDDRLDWRRRQRAEIESLREIERPLRAETERPRRATSVVSSLRRF